MTDVCLVTTDQRRSQRPLHITAAAAAAAAAASLILVYVDFHRTTAIGLPAHRRVVNVLTSNCAFLIFAVLVV